MQIDLLQTRGLKLLYWSFIFFIFHSEDCFTDSLGRIHGKAYPFVLVQMKYLKLNRQEQLGDEYFSIILGISPARSNYYNKSHICMLKIEIVE